MDVGGVRAPGVRGNGEIRPESVRLGKVLEFMRLLWAVDHGLHTLSKRMESRLGVTAPQRLVMRLGGRFPDSSSVHIAGLLSIHPSTLTGGLKRLEGRQCPSRTVDTLD